ncbi:SDR family NAD(P)-dependent oxidoreductase [Kordiimonas aestuarii]|uniref:SDR family NAD(P)-dependent oxidoreductase n=1 Tax=Kordiimonas aestuarii TaxID=1005925 RepID=UPI0021CFFBF2|nr:SDR family NAD(P)-dependent oxidoreductase [Kordiimonas aestuarii]
MDIKGKTALVTGGASGLGRATVEHFVSLGANVVILDLNDEAGAAVAAAQGGKVTYVNTNVTDEVAVANAVAVAKDKYGSVDIAVNCAGIGTPQKVLDRDGNRYPMDHFKKVISINLIGSYNVLAQAAEAMQTNEPNEDGERGVIINTASVAAFEGQIGQAAYAASKGGIAALTLPTAREFSRQGVRVMTIAPGFIHTPLFDGLPEAAVDSLKQQVVFPKRLGKPHEYAKLAAHIIDNAYLNGETIRMDAAARMAPK